MHLEFLPIKMAFYEQRNRRFRLRMEENPRLIHLPLFASWKAIEFSIHTCNHKNRTKICKTWKLVKCDMWVWIRLINQLNWIELWIYINKTSKWWPLGKNSPIELNYESISIKQVNDGVHVYTPSMMWRLWGFQASNNPHNTKVVMGCEGIDLFSRIWLW